MTTAAAHDVDAHEAFVRLEREIAHAEHEWLVAQEAYEARCRQHHEVPR